MSGALAWTAIVGFLTILATGQAALIGLVLRVVRAQGDVSRAELRELRTEILGELRVLGTRFDAVDRDLHRLHARVFDGEAPAA